MPEEAGLPKPQQPGQMAQQVITVDAHCVQRQKAWLHSRQEVGEMSPGEGVLRIVQQQPGHCREADALQILILVGRAAAGKGVGGSVNWHVVGVKKL